MNRLDFFQYLGQTLGLGFPKLSLLVKLLIVSVHSLVLVSDIFDLLLVSSNLSLEALGFVLQELKLVLSWDFDSVFILIPACLLVYHNRKRRIDAGMSSIVV